jgi:hypothetical protein
MPKEKEKKLMNLQIVGMQYKNMWFRVKNRARPKEFDLKRGYVLCGLYKQTIVSNLAGIKPQVQVLRIPIEYEDILDGDPVPDYDKKDYMMDFPLLDGR